MEPTDDTRNARLSKLIDQSRAELDQLEAQIASCSSSCFPSSSFSSLKQLLRELEKEEEEEEKEERKVEKREKKTRGKTQKPKNRNPWRKTLNKAVSHIRQFCVTNNITLPICSRQRLLNTAKKLGVSLLKNTNLTLNNKCITEQKSGKSISLLRTLVALSFPTHKLFRFILKSSNKRFSPAEKRILKEVFQSSTLTFRDVVSEKIRAIIRD